MWLSKRCCVLLFCLTTVVADALYTIHAWDVPEPQIEIDLNFCWASEHGLLVLRQECQVFKVRAPPLFHSKAWSSSTGASFESACFPGYFLRQKNYRFVLAKRDGSPSFGEFCPVSLTVNCNHHQP